MKNSVFTAYLKTIEIYDNDLNTWKLCGSMNYRRLGGGVGVVKLQSNSQLLLLTANSSSKSNQNAMAQNEQQAITAQTAPNASTVNILALIGAASSLSVASPITTQPSNTNQQQSGAAASGALISNSSIVDPENLNSNSHTNR
jgi:hypothetical protein